MNPSLLFSSGPPRASRLRLLFLLLALGLPQPIPGATLPTPPPLPDQDGAIRLPAQEWPHRPGERTLRVLVHYPGGLKSRITPRTGIMLTLHNWGGTDCVGTADPSVLARELNVIALCVNYLQSGPEEGIRGAEPYDFGWLQALDALRAVAWTRHELTRQSIPFARGRLFATGGSGGGNVALMCVKLAPRSFAVVVDMCGMKRLSDDVAFHLPGGSELNARWNRDPSHPHHLSRDAQEIRDLTHAGHLAQMQRLGCTTRFVSVHGVDDAVCPFEDALTLARRLTDAGLDVRPVWVDTAKIDGQVFLSSGHSLGDRTQIPLITAGPWLRADGPEARELQNPSDFERRESLRYLTSTGTYLIDYSGEYPIGRFLPHPAATGPESHRGNPPTP